MTIEQANAYFASLPEGFAPARQLQEALSAKAMKRNRVFCKFPCVIKIRRRCSGLPVSLPAATTQAVNRSLPASG